MAYSRRILHYSPGPSDLVGTVSDRAIAGCWFELHRQGGCGPGELRLKDEFADRASIEIGDWIGCEFDTDDRWYLGRVESRESTSPAGIVFRLEGMSVQLGEVFPGGFGRSIANGIPPHVYGCSELFSNDPDYSDETFDSACYPHELISLLLDQYVIPNTDIQKVPALLDSILDGSTLTSSKFRGEESARAIIKEMALRARNAAWGVNEDGEFFLLENNESVLATFAEGTDLLSLEETRERDNLYNRIVLTGGYVYSDSGFSDVPPHGLYRWRGNYLQPASRAQYGDRRIRMWVPWIRTPEDSQAFARAFFDVYAQPTAQFLVEVANQSQLLRPWLGQIRLNDKQGAELITAGIDSVRVQFDHAPRFRFQVGPIDPHILWPEPPHDERWEIPSIPIAGFGGDIITLGSEGESSSSSLASSSSGLFSSSLTSDLTSDLTSSEYCPLYDTFTDTDGTELESHTMDSGPGWTQHLGLFEINSNQAEHVNPTATSCRAYAATSLSDVRVTAVASTALNFSGASAPGVLLRASNGDNNWLLRIDRFNDTLRIFDRIATAHTARASTSFTASQGTEYTLEATANGTTLKLTVDGTTVTYGAATFNQTATSHGLISTQNGTVTTPVKYNSFECCIY